MPEEGQELAEVIDEMRKWGLYDGDPSAWIPVGCTENSRVRRWADRLALLLAEAHPQVLEKKEDTDTRVDTMGTSNDTPTAALNETKDATVTPTQGSDELRRAAQYVLDRFVQTEALGYRSRDRQFAITILQQALSDTGGGNQQPSELRGDPGAPRTVDGEARDK